jgi:hypothetical protein
MTTEKGWFIRSKEPNNVFWSLEPDAPNGWVTDIEKALLFVRQRDAQLYFENHFHTSMRSEFLVAGII